MKISVFLKNNRKVLFICFLAFIALMFRGVFFVDVRWWWGLFVVFPTGVYLLFLYSNDIHSNLTLRYRLQTIFSWLTLYSVVFLIFALFISAWWIFGIVIPIVLITIWGYLSANEIVNELPKRQKLIIFYSTSVLFVLLIGLYCIPSYVSNNDSNPKDRFSQNYNAVQSYSVYGISGVIDREHVIPIDWYSNEHNFVNDYVNVIWSNKIANGTRSNFEFGIVPKIDAYAIRSGTEIVGYLKDGYFMPTDEYIGDIARIVLYMYVTYKDDGLPTNRINLNLMKEWARKDPVDQRERDRNTLIKATYGYDNRFINNPWLIGFVF